MTSKIFFINHKKSNCGVYEFGKRIGMILKKSKRFSFIYLEISSQKSLEKHYNLARPNAIIYNYTGDGMPWLKTYKFLIPQVSVIHEITSSVSKKTFPNLTDYYIAPDPSLIRNNSLVFKTSRLVLKNNINHLPKRNSVVKIGSFGFGTKNKNFVDVVRAVSKEFKKAQVNLNIPPATFGGNNLDGAKKHIKECQNYLKKFPNIKLNYSHKYLAEKDLINFLKKNDINVFFYKDKKERGISSVIDYALSAEKPIAISDCNMFRHINHPSIVYNNKNSLKTILSKKDKIISKFIENWTPENLIWEYETIIENILKNHSNKYLFIYNFKYLRYKIERLLRKYLNKQNPFQLLWSQEDNYIKFVDKLKDDKIINKVNRVKKFNRFLTMKDLQTFSSSIAQLKKLAPDLMNRKNKLANSQQAFIFDVTKSLIKNKSKKILCVGSYEDSAYEALYRLNYNIDAIDPLLNYDLNDFITKPTTKKKSYDLIFSTSVLEHVYDDISFIKQCELLLKKGGYLVFTCDYKKDFKNGDSIPGTNFRFYNKEKIKEILKSVPKLQAIDKINFEENNKGWFTNDFKYTFCAITLKKIN